MGRLAACAVWAARAWACALLGGCGGATAAPAGADAGGDCGAACAVIDAGMDASDPGALDAGTNDAGADAAGASCSALSAAQCQDCCNDAHGEGSTTYSLAVGTCACEFGNCDMACATELCAPMPTPPAQGDACDTCIQASLAPDGGCAMTVGTDCSRDPDCVAYLACAKACPASM